MVDTAGTIDETRSIELPRNGGTLDVSMTPEFRARIQKHFGLAEGQHVDDDLIRMFIYGSCKSALDKAEAEPSK